MNLIYKRVLVSLVLLLGAASVWGQGSADYAGGLKMKLNDDGSKYIRFITWHQMWSTTTFGENSSTDFLLRRSRMLAFAQINKRFLILTHFGLNSLSPGRMGTASPSEVNGGNGHFFMHDAWVDYTIIPGKLNLGGGLHYWNGISRLTNQSTLNFLTLDAPIHNWATIGTSDQFARHLGFYAKGKLGRFDYRISFNEALSNPSRGAGSNVMIDDSTGEISYITDRAIYRNPLQAGGGKVLQGYFNYQFLDKESNLLPYFVGSYLGTKKVFNIGAGFFFHDQGSSSRAANGDVILHSPVSFAVDAFYDTPLGDNGSGFTGYASYAVHNWGPNWTGGVGGVGTGNILYTQLGYLLPGEKTDKARLQPYVHFTARNLEANQDWAAPGSSSLGIGANVYLDGHHSKITGEFQINQAAGELESPESRSLFRLQLMIFL